MPIVTVSSLNIFLRENKVGEAPTVKNFINEQKLQEI